MPILFPDGSFVIYVWASSGLQERMGRAGGANSGLKFGGEIRGVAQNRCLQMTFCLRVRPLRYHKDYE